MECIDCKIELIENPVGPEKETDEHYTMLGSGPYCEKCYEKWQAIDDRLKQEAEQDYEEG